VRHPLLAGARGEGLLLALELSADVAPAVASAALEAGFIVNAVAPDAIRLAPPLVLTRAQAGDFVASLPAILDAARPAAAAAAAADTTPADDSEDS